MGLFSRPTSTPEQTRDHAARAAAWEDALARAALPPFVEQRLADARAGRTPWVASMTPAELLTARSHGIRPVATVSGTCWFNYGWSWTEGHAEGWHRAQDRIREEARAAGANAIVDVRMRTLRHSVATSMDFTLIGTAVRMEGLKPSPDPIIATVPALEFVRLLEMGIVPVGIAVGARYEWLGLNGWNGGWSGGGAQVTQMQSSVFAGNQPLTELGNFWEEIRRDALEDLRRNAARLGNGVLAHTQFGQIVRRERDKQPPAYLGRHIVIGTVVDTPRGAGVPHGIEPVIDMRDAASPFRAGGMTRHSAYQADVQDEEGAI